MNKWVPTWWPELLHASKTAIAALVALGIALLDGQAMPFRAMTTVFIVSNPVAAATRSKAVYRALGTKDVKTDDQSSALQTSVELCALADWASLQPLTASRHGKSE